MRALVTWLISLVLFSAFACVSLYKALSGHATCGCFGTIEVNPWYALTLDAAIVVSLLVFRPTTICVPGVFPVQFSTRAGLVCLIWLVFGGYAGFRASVAETAALSDAGEIIGEGDVVVLEPEKWVGKRFPLLDHIENAERLRTQAWTVVLYHLDCTRCKEVIWQLLTSGGGRRTEPDHITLIELPPYGEDRDYWRGLPAFGIRCRLPDSRKWFAETPAVLSLQEGIVTEVDDPVRRNDSTKSVATPNQIPHALGTAQAFRTVSVPILLDRSEFHAASSFSRAFCCFDGPRVSVRCRRD